ncbi:MAG: hypothetical protein DHS20C18_52860 [Saprospiraceae bacterium]|nr:MAG: hypothetical protein DHS20C18_52860 [Saprospiraceae bacterium]
MLGGLYLIYEPASVASSPVATALPVNNVNIRPGAATIPFNFTAAAEKATPAVVYISASANGSARSDNNNDNNPFRLFFGDDLFGGPQAGSGTGVIYSSDGYIITNNHVVGFADKVEVTLFDNRKFEAKIIGTDEKADLAVIKIEAYDLPTLKLANSDNARVGEWVLAVGNPFDLTSTVTAGIISAKGRSLQLLQGRDAIEAFIQTDAAVNPGNSGGALVDTEGQLLGINTAIATQNGSFQGYSFAIPINLAKRIIDDIIEYGSFQRAFLGVNIYPLDNDAANELGLDISQGVVIEDLVDGGSAQYAGLQPKDVIVKVDDYIIKDVPELTEIVGRAKVGDILNITVNRRGEALQVPVRMRPSRAN